MSLKKNLPTPQIMYKMPIRRMVYISLFFYYIFKKNIFGDTIFFKINKFKEEIARRQEE
jgi:hypothetical protein